MTTKQRKMRNSIDVPTRSVLSTSPRAVYSSNQDVPAHASDRAVVWTWTRFESSICTAVTMSDRKNECSQLPPPAIMPGKVKPTPGIGVA